MAEYINRDEFIKSQCHSCDGYCDVIECDCLNCKHECRCDTIADLLDYPAADVVERKKGKWIGGELGHCSCCGNEGCFSDIWPDGQERYCPNCGADMR